MVADVVVIILSYLAALLVRFEFRYHSIPAEFLQTYHSIILPWALVSIVVLALFGCYNSVWRYVGMGDLRRLVAAHMTLVAIGAVCIVLLRYHMPRSYYVMGFALSFFCCTAMHFSYRFLLQLSNEFFGQRHRAPEMIMIVGAGEAARNLIRDFQVSDKLNASVACLIDDNPVKYRAFLEGIRIVGDRDTIPAMVRKYRISRIILAMPGATAQQRKEILEICSKTKCRIQVLPGLYQLVNGEVSVSQLKDVEVQDLLGREPISVDLDDIREFIRGKVVMVTGGGGSIGSELCRQIAKSAPEQLIIFDIYENNAYDIQMELKRKHPELNLEVLIGSVRNTARLSSVFETYRPQVVFHAAAHKHVPLMEDSPNEAIKNNVFGTYKTATMADRYGVEKFVLISTDKAVNPTNIMGASKRLCEMVVQMMSRKSETDFVAVRFGNVLGSNGSVIPLFKRQIQEGGPVTITHPDIIRYFMTIPEAVSLVLQAGAFAKGGEIFVLDMGQPVKIADMAKNLIRLSGFEPDVDIPIVYTGLRPGEKLYEELLMDEEGLQDTENKLIHIGKPIMMDDEQFCHQLERLRTACESESREIKQIVAEIVPTYHPSK